MVAMLHLKKQDLTSFWYGPQKWRYQKHFSNMPNIHVPLKFFTFLVHDQKKFQLKVYRIKILEGHSQLDHINFLTSMLKTFIKLVQIFLGIQLWVNTIHADTISTLVVTL